MRNKGNTYMALGKGSNCMPCMDNICDLNIFRLFCLGPLALLLLTYLALQTFDIEHSCWRLFQKHYLCFDQFRCNFWRPIAQKQLLIQTIISPFSLGIHIFAHPNATLLRTWFMYNQQKWHIGGVNGKSECHGRVKTKCYWLLFVASPLTTQH